MKAWVWKHKENGRIVIQSSFIDDDYRYELLGTIEGEITPPKKIVRKEVDGHLGQLTGMIRTQYPIPEEAKNIKIAYDLEE